MSHEITALDSRRPAACSAGRGRVHVHRLVDGAPVGYMDPDAAVGGRPNCGWADMPNSLTAFRRSDGGYIIVVEEDFRAKKLIYHWKPVAGAAAAPTTTR